MLNQQIISPEIAPLHPDETVEQALQRMEDGSLSHLPLVKDGHLVALLSENDLLGMDNLAKLGEFPYAHQAFTVNAEDHFLTAARLMTSRNLDVVPVVSASNEYVGLINQAGIMHQLTQLTGLMDGGALVVLEMDPQQLSISQLAKLVETNDAHITQFNTAIDQVSGRMVVTIRINKQEVSDIIATFQRYDYHVVFYSGEEHYENELRRNYNHLMNFLSM